MDTTFQKIRLILLSISVLLALVIIIDFILPAKSVTDEIISIKKERQQYYNAARNHHLSYKVITGNNQFSVSETFAKAISANQDIEYSISPLFKEVNRYGVPNTQLSGTFSLRILSGLIFPLLVLITMGLGYKYGNKVGTLVFVVQVLLIINLVYLIK